MAADGRRLLKLGPYTIYAGASAAVMTATSPMVEATAYTKLLLGTSIGAFIVNVVAALWAFSFTGVIEDDSWKILVFKTVFYFTAILSPFSAVSLLLPKKLKWYLFAIICVTMICLIITLFKNKLKASLTLAYEKVVAALRMRLFMTADDQVLPISKALIPAKEEHNLGGSGSSPTLPCISATGPATSQEQPNLNGPPMDLCANIAKVTVIAALKDDLLKFRIPISSGLSELKNELAQRLGLKGKKLIIKYKDSDSDWIVITCDDDLHTLPEFLASNTTVKLHVACE